MQKQVADASAVLAVILGEKHRSKVIAASEDADLIAPDSLAWEVGNALVANVRRGRLTPKQCRSAVARFEEVPLRVERISLDSAVVIALEGDERHE